MLKMRKKVKHKRQRRVKNRMNKKKILKPYPRKQKMKVFKTRVMGRAKSRS